MTRPRKCPEPTENPESLTFRLASRGWQIRGQDRPGSGRREPALDRVGDRAAPRGGGGASSRSRSRASASRRTSASSPRRCRRRSSPSATCAPTATSSGSFADVGRGTRGGLDLLVHSVAFAAAEDLEGRFIDTPRDRFWIAQDVSAYSLVACARAAEPLMRAARRRLDRDDDLPRRRARGAALQRDGRRQGGARRLRPLPGLGPRRRAGHARERRLGRPGAHALGALDRRLPDDGGDRRGARAAAPPHRRGRRGRRRGLPALGRRAERDRRRRSTSTPATTRWACSRRWLGPSCSPS